MIACFSAADVWTLIGLLGLAMALILLITVRP